MKNKPQKIIALVGPTAIGKTELSLFIAKHLSVEIISMDSMQIYKEMNIGTAKPSKEEQAVIPHHLVDFVSPNQHYDVSDFVRDATIAIATIVDHHHLPLLVGGTGLYLRGLLSGLFAAPEINQEIRQRIRDELKNIGNEALHLQLQHCDPLSAQRIHVNDSQRLCRALEIYQATGTPWSTFLAKEQANRPNPNLQAIKIGLQRPRPELYDRINQRVEIMIAQGLVREVEGLLQRYSPKEKAMQSIGYRHIIEYLQGNWDWPETVRLLARDTRRYAKRQLTWFQHDNEIAWFHPDDHHAILSAIKKGLL